LSRTRTARVIRVQMAKSSLPRSAGDRTLPCICTRPLTRTHTRTTACLQPVDRSILGFQGLPPASRVQSRGSDGHEWMLRAVRLPAPIHPLYHPLYVLVSKILSSILNSPASIHPLYHPLSTLFTVGPTCHFI
jgi:hypothetical protein